MAGQSIQLNRNTDGASISFFRVVPVNGQQQLITSHQVDFTTSSDNPDCGDRL